MEIACRATRQFAQHRSIATILFVLKTWKLVDTVILTREYSNYAYIVHQTQQNCHIDEVWYPVKMSVTWIFFILMKEHQQQLWNSTS